MGETLDISQLLDVDLMLPHQLLFQAVGLLRRLGEAPRVAEE